MHRKPFRWWDHDAKKHRRRKPHLPIAAPTRVHVVLSRRHKRMKATVTWNDPTTLADNTTAIPAGDFAFVQVSRSVDNGQSYTPVGHAAPGAQSFVDDVSALSPGAVLYKLNSVDTQSPALTGPDSAVASVTIAAPELAPIAAPSNVGAALSP